MSYCESGNNNFNNLYSRPPNFCEDCGDLLDFNKLNSEFIICQRCDGEIPISTITKHEITMVNDYNNSKDWINKLDNTIDKLKKKQELVRSTIERLCMKCNSNKMYYFTMQTRSADEGSTVFYECVKCGDKSNENN